MISLQAINRTVPITVPFCEALTTVSKMILVSLSLANVLCRNPTELWKQAYGSVFPQQVRTASNHKHAGADHWEYPSQNMQCQQIVLALYSLPNYSLKMTHAKTLSLLRVLWTLSEPRRTRNWKRTKGKLQRKPNNSHFHLMQACKIKM